MVKCVIIAIVLAISSSISLAQSPLSDVEKLHIEIINLKNALIDAKRQLGKSQYELSNCHITLNQLDVQSNMQSLQHAIDSTRPGFVYDLQTGQFKPKE